MNEMFSQGGKGSTGILTNKQAVARHFGVKQSEVVYFSVGALLTGYKVIYDKVSQRAYSLPADIGSGVTAVSLSPAGVLVHSAGNVDLGALAVAREEYVTLPGSFTTGVTVNTKNELVVFTDGKYRWDGVLPKEVPSGSSPLSSGGTGDGAWIVIRDAHSVIYKDTTVGDYLSVVNPQKTEAGFENNSSDTNASVLTDSINTTDVILVPSYYNLSGVGFSLYRSDRTSMKTISKTGNSTHSFVNQDKTVQVRDAVIAVDPVWFDGRWPQQTSFEKLAILGDRESPNECGLFLFQGSGYRVRDTTFSGCKNSILIGDCWVSEFTNCQSMDGAFSSTRGTSQRWSGCWSAGHPDIIGAYHFTDTTYTTLTSCASDHAPRTAYFFENGSEVTMISCGAEFPVSVDTGLGSMIGLNGNSKVTVIGFKGVPTAEQNTPLISVGNGDTLHLINWNSHHASYPNSIDISINGDGSTVIIEDSQFSGTATGNIAFPRVHFRGNYTNSRVIVKYKQNEYVYICPTGGGFVKSPEPMFTNVTTTPTLLVNNAPTTGFTYADQSGFFTKNGNVATYHFQLRVTGKTNIASAATVKLSLTELPATIIPGAVATGTLIVSGASSFDSGGCFAEADNRYLYLYSTSRTELTGANVIAGTRISGSISFYIKDTGWK